MRSSSIRSPHTRWVVISSRPMPTNHAAKPISAPDQAISGADWSRVSYDEHLRMLASDLPVALLNAGIGPEKISWEPRWITPSAYLNGWSQFAGGTAVRFFKDGA